MIFVLLKTVHFYMKGVALVLLILACMLILPAGSAYACSSKHTTSHTEIKHAPNKKVCCNEPDRPKQRSKKKTCGHGCGRSSCCCAHGSSVFVIKTHPVILIQKGLNIISQANSWFFKESTPQPVYLSLWMPPNINC